MPFHSRGNLRQPGNRTATGLVLFLFCLIFRPFFYLFDLSVPEMLAIYSIIQP